MRLIASVLFILALATSSIASTVVVPDDFADIRSAISAASPGDTVLLRPGTYDGPMNTDIDFAGVNLVLKGEGGAASVTIDCTHSSRAFYFHSGEDASAVVTGVSVINGSAARGGAIRCIGAGPTLESCVFFGNAADTLGGAISLESSDARIIDCEFAGNRVLTNGYGQGGAGVHCLESSPGLLDCVFRDGSASSGGGVYCIDGSSPEVARCRFDSNVAWYNGGGGLFCYDGSCPHVYSCTFNCNSAGRCGGGVYSEYSSPVLSECVFSSNESVGWYGRWGGGGAYLRSGSPVVESCAFSLNSAERGGAIYCGDAVDVRIVDTKMSHGSADVGAGVCCVESSTVHMADCLIVGGASISGAGIYAADSVVDLERTILCDNESTGSDPDYDGGGALYMFNGSAQLWQCTLAANAAIRGGGILARETASLQCLSSTLVACSATEGAGCYLMDSSAHLANTVVASCDGVSFGSVGASGVTCDCSDVWGNSGGDWVDVLSGLDGISGNICSDPLFCGGTDVYEAYQLQEGSPCSDAVSGCGQIGAWGVGCDYTTIRPITWGRLKASYR